MGTSTSAREFAGKLARMANEVQDPKPALIEAAEAGKTIFRAAAASKGAIGVKPVGKRKAVGVRDDFLDRTSVIVTYTGAAHLLNNPTRPHFIGARRLGSRGSLAAASRGVGAVTAFGGTAQGMFGSLSAQRVSRNGIRRQASRALSINGDFRAYAFHPGTAGKDFFADAKKGTLRVVPPLVARKLITQPARAIFR